jgi:hypothetical protein
MSKSYYKKAEYFLKIPEWFCKMAVLIDQMPEWMNKAPDFIEKTNVFSLALRELIIPRSLILYSFAKWYLLQEEQVF